MSLVFTWMRKMSYSKKKKKRSEVVWGEGEHHLNPLTSAFETRPAGTTFFAFILAAWMMTKRKKKWPPHECNLESRVLTALEQQRFLHFIAANYHCCVSMHRIKPEPFYSENKSESLISSDDLWLVSLITLGNNTAAMEIVHLTPASFLTGYILWDIIRSARQTEARQCDSNTGVRLAPNQQFLFPHRYKFNHLVRLINCVYNCI